MTTCQIIITFLEKYKNPKIKSQFIQNSISKNISEIKDYIICQNNFGDSFNETTEYDIYRAYGLLWSLRYVLNSAKIEEISKFNFKDYTNFAEFLKNYGNSKKLSKNYQKNFIEALGQLELNENFVYSWIKKLKESKLSSMKTNSNKTKNESKKDNNIIENFKDKTSSVRNEVENNFSPQNVPNWPNNNLSSKIALTDNKDVLKQENNSQNIVGAFTHLKDSKTIIESGSIISQIPFHEKFNQNNDSGEDVIQNETAYQKAQNTLGTNNSIINAAQKEIICDENNQITPHKNDNFSNIINNNIQIITENISYEVKKNDSIYCKHKDEFLDQNIIIERKEPKNNANNAKKEEISQNNRKEENREEENSKENSEVEIKTEEFKKYKMLTSLPNQEKDSLKKNSTNLSNEQLLGIIISLQNKLNSLQDKMESDMEKVKKRVLKLEVNQCLMYHQLALYENSRDIGKSICYYFFEYLDAKILSKDNFSKLKTIIHCLEGKIENNKIKNINPEIRENLLKFFKFHFFINKVLNKIIHRNISEQCQSLLEQQKENDILPPFPGFNFSQCFESLGYFVDKGWENPQIQTIMKYVYDNMYKNDKGLENIYDADKIVIIPSDDIIKISLNKKDIENIKNYFENLKMELYNSSFADLCNQKIWDEEEKSN